MSSASLVSFDYLKLTPVLAPALGALLVLLLDAIASRLRRLHFTVGVLAMLAGAATALPGALLPGSGRSLSLCLPAPVGACLWSAGPVASALQLGALGSTLTVLLLLWPGHASRLPALRGGPAVTVALLLSATAGACAVAAARDLGSWLVAIELATLPVVVLVALRGSDRAGAGALSLLTTSLVSFALLVVGAALWLVATGDATFAATSASTAWSHPETRAVLVLAALFLLAGLGFKLSLVPFHTWTPQAYAGSSEPVAALLAATSKIAALAALLVVLEPLTRLGGGPSATSVRLVIAAIAALSMTLGNVLALRQEDPVRLLAWSTVAQAGWVLLPLAALIPQALGASAGYVLAYAMATLLAFAVVTVHTGRALTAYRGLFRLHPLLAGLLAFALVSLAGLPPGILGLVAKIVALRPVVDDGLWWLALVAVANAVLGIAVYLRWVAVLFGDPATDATPRIARSSLAALLLVASALVATSAAPQLLLGLLG